MDKRNPDWQLVVNELLSANTQDELAGKLGVAQQQVSSLKNGHRGKRISYTLGYDLLKLYGNLSKSKA